MDLSNIFKEIEKFWTRHVIPFVVSFTLKSNRLVQIFISIQSLSFNRTVIHKMATSGWFDPQRLHGQSWPIAAVPPVHVDVREGLGQPLDKIRDESDIECACNS